MSDRTIRTRRAIADILATRVPEHQWNHAADRSCADMYRVRYRTKAPADAEHAAAHQVATLLRDAAEAFALDDEAYAWTWIRWAAHAAYALEIVHGSTLLVDAFDLPSEVI